MSAPELSMPELLARAGAMLRGRNRADCPRCGARRTISYTEEVFCCHHAGCEFKGNTVTLAKELGLLRRLSPAEYERMRREGEETERLARFLVAKRRERRWELQARYRQLLGIKLRALEVLERDPDDESAWGALALVYRELPAVQQALDGL
jgi:hypothetical protein